MNKIYDSVESLVAAEEFQNYCLAPNPQRQAFWDNWLQENPDKKGIFEEATKWVLSMSSTLASAEKSDAYEDLLQKIDVQKAPKARIRKFSYTKLLAGIAATVLVLLIGYWAGNRTSLPEKVLYSTNFGETQKITLPDGSELTLNANSTLEFVKNWKDQEIRQAWLKGEGFFDIKSNPEKAFILHTDKGQVEVLGTSFNVFQRAQQLDVTLIEGKVNLHIPNREYIQMAPGEQVRLNNTRLEHTEIDTEPITAWKFDKMIFRDASIQSIITKLKSDFDWKVEVQKPAILQKRVNAVVHQNNPEVLLNALAEIYDLDIEKLGEGSYLIK